MKASYAVKLLKDLNIVPVVLLEESIVMVAGVVGI
jgi:hypothetical protein